MRERHLRRRCRALLRELDVPRPFGHRELCRRLARHRGRPIRLMPFPIEQPGPSGIWLATDVADVIVYQSQTTAAHQEHIILHEVGTSSPVTTVSRWIRRSPCGCTGEPPTTTVRNVRPS